MKTLKFFIVFCLVTVTNLNIAKAQNGVVKEVLLHSYSGCQYWSCINEYIDAYADVQLMFMQNKWSVKVKKFTVVGYIDACKTPSTNVYECMENQEVNKTNTQNHMVVKQNGKLVFTYFYTLRVDEKTGDVTFENEVWNCH